jgi:hypothetical protein
MWDLPKQRLSFKEKSKNDFEWAKKTIDAIIATSPDQNKDIHRMKSNYQLYNNQLNQQDFERECNPLNIDVGQFKDTIQPYNKTYNKIQVLLSEELSRPFVFKTLLVNADGVKSKLMYRDNLLKTYIQNKVSNTIRGLYGEQAEEEGMMPEEINKYMKYTFLDAKEVTANRIMEYLWKKLSIDGLKNESFKHGLISGVELCYVGRKDDDPYVSILNPLNTFYYKSEETRYVQDGLYAGYRTTLSNYEILDRYGMYLSDEDKRSLEDKFPTGNYIGNEMKYPEGVRLYDYNTYQTYTDGNDEVSSQTVVHVEWRSARKVGFLSWENEFGDPEQMIVSEDTAIPPHAETKMVTKKYGRKCKYYYFDGYSLYFDYVPEIWTGIKIGSEIYCKIGPKEDQFRSMDNPYDVKLGYHGIAYSSLNAPNISLMDRMKPFQYLYFIVMHKLKKLIARDEGMVYKFDYSMVDPKLGIEKTLYYIKEMGIDIYNSLQNADQPGSGQRGVVTQAVNMSNMQYIMSYVNLLASIDQQISDVAGVSRQKEGQMVANEAVGNNQAAIQMSSLVTEIYFHIHYSMWGEVLTSLLNTASSCYQGKHVVKQFILDDLSIGSLEVSPGDLINSDFGIFVSSSIKDNNMFKSLQGIAADLIRSTRASFSDLISLYTSTSSEELKNTIIASEEKTNAQAQQSQQAQIQAQLQVEESKKQTQLELANIAAETKIKVAEIGSFARQMDQDVNDNNVPDQLELEKLRVNTRLKERELDIKEKALNKK